MKNLIRFFGFFLALFLATTLSAQTNTSPTGSKGASANPTGPTAGGAKEYVSTMDNAVIDILPGQAASYAVYIKKQPEGEYFLVESRNVMGTSSPQDAMVNQPGSFSLKIIVNSYGHTVTFSE